MWQISILLAILASSAHCFPLTLEKSSCFDGDGLYSLGCNYVYAKCISGVEYFGSCSIGLYFNPILSRCERRQHIYNCQKKHDTNEVLRQRALTFNCKNREDGFYAFDKDTCDNKFYYCSNGTGTVRLCQHMQYYNPQLSRCVSLEECENPSENIVNTPISFIQNIHFFAASEIDNIENGLDCDILGETTFGKVVCHYNYWKCSNGILTRETCRNNLVYDLENNWCDIPERVKGCSDYQGFFGYSEDTEAMKQLAGIISLNPSLTQTQIDSMKEWRCEKDYDGLPFVPLGNCIQSFATCTGEELKVLKCDDRLVYDASVRSCKPKSECTVPKKEKTIWELHNMEDPFKNNDVKDELMQIRATTTTTTNIPSYEIPYTAAPETTTPQHVKYDCSQMADGGYATIPCKSQFILCLDKTAYDKDCDFNTVFNPATRICEEETTCVQSFLTPSTTSTFPDNWANPIWSSIAEVI